MRIEVDSALELDEATAEALRHRRPLEGGQNLPPERDPWEWLRMLLRIPLVGIVLLVQALGWVLRNTMRIVRGILLWPWRLSQTWKRRLVWGLVLSTGLATALEVPPGAFMEQGQALQWRRTQSRLGAALHWPQLKDIGRSGIERLQSLWGSSSGPTHASRFQIIPECAAVVPGTWWQVERQRVNVRSGPGTRYSAIAQVARGDVVLVSGALVGDWLPVQLSHEQGYVRASLGTCVQETFYESD